MRDREPAKKFESDQSTGRSLEGFEQRKCRDLCLAENTLQQWENGEGGHADWRLVSQQGAWGINQARDKGAGPRTSP